MLASKEMIISNMHVKAHTSLSYCWLARRSSTRPKAAKLPITSYMNAASIL
jgi:hypothetical protein